MPPTIRSRLINKQEHKAYYYRLFGIVPPDGTITDELRRVLSFTLRNLYLSKFYRSLAPLTGAKEEAAESGEDGNVIWHESLRRIVNGQYPSASTCFSV